MRVLRIFHAQPESVSAFDDLKSNRIEVNNRRLVVVVCLQFQQLDRLSINRETCLTRIEFDHILFQSERSRGRRESPNHDLIGAVAAKLVLTFLQPKQPDERQPSTVTLEIS